MSPPETLLFTPIPSWCRYEGLSKSYDMVIGTLRVTGPGGRPNSDLVPVNSQSTVPPVLSL